jgi:hypothetical protein
LFPLGAPGLCAFGETSLILLWAEHAEERADNDQNKGDYR